jgi:hypothetical protein
MQSQLSDAMTFENHHSARAIRFNSEEAMHPSKLWTRITLPIKTCIDDQIELHAVDSRSHLQYVSRPWADLHELPF